MTMNLKVPIIGILRGVTEDFFRQIMDTSFTCGIQALEVTINTEGALAMVEKNRPFIPEGALLGMGTIRTLDEAKQVINAGAIFLVSPNFYASVIEYAHSHQVPVIAGALTPTEVFSAWNAGAAMVKVFPCGSMGGPQYIKNLRGPFDKIPLVAVGGVTKESLTDYFAAGVKAIGVSSSLFGRQALAKKNIVELEQNVQTFVDFVMSLKQHH